MATFVLPTPIGGSGGGGGEGVPGPAGKSTYQLAQQQGYSGTLDEWLADQKGAPGEDGAPGNPGNDGKSVELQKSEGAIQWRQTEGEWTDIVQLSEITGPAGEDGSPESTYVATTLSSVVVPAEISSILVTGYYEVGDAPVVVYKRVGAEPTHPGKLQSSGGAWWELQSTGIIEASLFGVKPESGFDNAPRINAATDYLVAKFGGGQINYGTGHFGLSGEVIIKTRISHIGTGRRSTRFIRNVGYIGDLWKTLDFETLNAGNTAGGPNRFRLERFSIDGQKDIVTTATGWCLRIYGRAYIINEVEIEQCPAGGFYSRWGGSSAAWDDTTDLPPLDSVMETLIDGLYIQFTKGTPVYDGPHDAQIARMVVAMIRWNEPYLEGSSSLVIGDRSGGTQFLSLHVWGRHPEWCVTNWADYISITDLILDDCRENGGLLRHNGDCCRIQGRGLQFGTDQIKGVQLGSGAYGNVIDLMLDRTPLVAIDWGNDGGNDVRLSVQAPSTQIRFAGTRHASTTLQYYERGAGANAASPYLYRFGGFAITAEGLQFPNLSADPAPSGIPNGTVYFNTTSLKHRVCRSGAWADL